MADGTILVVDDEKNIRDVIQYALEQEGFAVSTAADGRDALARVSAGGVDLLVLDVLMPELDGLSLCRTLREHSNIPIVFVSSRTEEVDKIIGLEMGGDDYLAKPFSPRELTTRVKAILRRTKQRAHQAATEPLTHGCLALDSLAHELWADKQRVELTVTEFRVLQVVLQHPGRVFTRSQLIQRAYLNDHHVTERTIDSHIRRIRKKLRPFGADPIETVHGLGYKAQPCPSAAGHT